MLSLLIRADGGVETGTGHIMRCQALAQAWQDIGGKVDFAVCTIPEALEEKIVAEGMQVHHVGKNGSGADETKELGVALGADWIVLDGYAFDEGFSRAIMREGLRLLVIDDFGGAAAWPADLVLNQNVSADATMYAKCRQETALLLGTRYTLLRREFRRLTQGPRDFTGAERILVTLGGADPDNVTRTVIDAILQMDRPLEVAVIVGSANPRAESFKRAAVCSKSRIQIHVNPSNIAEFMAWADVAISSSGTTCWELAFMALPTLLIITAENQRLSAERLAAMEAARNLGWHKELTAKEIAEMLTNLLDDFELRESMATKASKLVDGYGASRVVTEMHSRLLAIRRAGAEDSELLLDWANEATARAASFSSAQITPAEHRNWFERKLNDSSCELMIALDQQRRRIGQVRFDREEEHAVISVSVEQTYRGRGIGAAVIRRASCEFLSKDPQGSVMAYVKPDNVASHRAFLKAGFREIEPGSVRGQSAHRLLLRKADCAQ